jgi:hypothetical protein
MGELAMYQETSDSNWASRWVDAQGGLHDDPGSGRRPVVEVPAGLPFQRRELIFRGTWWEVVNHFPATQDGERYLLLIHGTARQTAKGFAGMEEVFRQLMASGRYQGIFAFDHRTIFKKGGCWSNAKQLREAIGNRLGTFDLMAMSRGVQIGRLIAEGVLRSTPTARLPNIGNVVWVAGPHKGTPKAGWLAMGGSLTMSGFGDLRPNGPLQRKLERGGAGPVASGTVGVVGGISKVGGPFGAGELHDGVVAKKSAWGPRFGKLKNPTVQGLWLRLCGAFVNADHGDLMKHTDTKQAVSRFLSENTCLCSGGGLGCSYASRLCNIAP